MSGNVLEYKGYYTKVEYSVEDKVLHGKIEGIDDLINFECENVLDVESAFHEAVEDYITFCQEVGKEPNKIYKGSFNVRIDPNLHRKAAMLAYANNESLNQVVEKAIDVYVNGTHNQALKWISVFNDLIENSRWNNIQQIPVVNKQISKLAEPLWTNKGDTKISYS